MVTYIFSSSNFDLMIFFISHKSNNLFSFSLFLDNSLIKSGRESTSNLFKCSNIHSSIFSSYFKFTCFDKGKRLAFISYLSLLNEVLFLISLFIKSTKISNSNLSYNYNWRFFFMSRFILNSLGLIFPSTSFWMRDELTFYTNS